MSQKMFNHFVWILLLLAYHSPAHASLSCKDLFHTYIENPAALVKHLARHGLKVPEEEGPTNEAFFLLYKKDPQFAAWAHDHSQLFETPSEALIAYRQAKRALPYIKSRTWDLTQRGRLGELNTTNEIKIGKHPMMTVDSRYREHLTYYEEMILMMRAGDKLRLPKASGSFDRISENTWDTLKEKPKVYIADPSEAPVMHFLVPKYKGEVSEIVLGEFIGSGNQTMIFAIADRPGYVIRLPFRSLITRYVYQSRESELDQSRSSLFKMIQSKPPTSGKVLMVEPVEYGPLGEYIIVNRVHGRQDGYDFLKEHEALIETYFRDKKQQTPISLNPSQLRQIARESETPLLRTEEIYDMYRKLEEALKRVNSVHDIWYHQFVWDRSLSEWVLVDY